MADEVALPGPGGEEAPSRELRASHEDRDQVVEVLRTAAGDGRLTAEEPEVSSGSLSLVTKPGIAVDTDDVAIRSGEVKVRAPWGSEAPVRLRVEVSGKVGSGQLRARPPRRTFWQWLGRRPGRYALTSS
jgi:hypothetical protein